MDAFTTTQALGGKWLGHYGVALCPAHNNVDTPALSLSDGEKGLLLHCHTGCDFASIMAALRDRKVMDGGNWNAAPDPAKAAAYRARVKAKAEMMAGKAFKLWQEALPIEGSLAETYLRGRGITCALPETLRFTPSCWHLSGQRLPALVALVEGADDFAVHRTYLRANGAGKADVDPPKAMLGAVHGGAVRLIEGPRKLVVAEGIETALSFASGLIESPVRVWAALSTSGLKGLRLPEEPGQLTIASDGDEAGEEAARILKDRASGLGWQVSLLPAPKGWDWNDVLARKAVKA